LQSQPNLSNCLVSRILIIVQDQYLDHGGGQALRLNVKHKLLIPHRVQRLSLYFALQIGLATGQQAHFTVRVHAASQDVPGHQVPRLQEVNGEQVSLRVEVQTEVHGAQVLLLYAVHRLLPEELLEDDRRQLNVERSNNTNNRKELNVERSNNTNNRRELNVERVNNTDDRRELNVEGLNNTDTRSESN
jgi:hypothetical protein